MLRLHHGAPHLLLVLAALPLLSHHSAGATVFGLSPQLDYDTRLELPLGQQAGERGVWEEDLAVVRDGLLPLTSSRSRAGEQQQQQQREAEDEAKALLRAVGEEENPSLTYLPERYLFFPPEDRYLRELLRHSPAGGDQQWSGTLLPPSHRSRILTHLPPSQPPLSYELPSAGLARVKDWTRPQLAPQQQQQQLQQYVKQKRLSQQPQHQPWAQQQRYGGGLKVAQKRWWGGRQRGPMDRRASQSKHYDCLKSCIKEGRLHPIQCHTLC